MKTGAAQLVADCLDLVFGLGVERLLLVLEKQGWPYLSKTPLDVYIASPEAEEANLKALELISSSLHNRKLKRSVIASISKLKARFEVSRCFWS